MSTMKTSTKSDPNPSKDTQTDFADLKKAGGNKDSDRQEAAKKAIDGPRANKLDTFREEIREGFDRLEKKLIKPEMQTVREVNHLKIFFQAMQGLQVDMEGKERQVPVEGAPKVKKDGGLEGSKSQQKTEAQTSTKSDDNVTKAQTRFIVEDDFDKRKSKAG
jgi:hypothetical protein